jgi:hypothetical protein
MKRPDLYDLCHELAEAFLNRKPHLATVERTDELAELIQVTIEDFINHEHANYDGGEP